jgi:hypothetical protein
VGALSAAISDAAAIRIATNLSVCIAFFLSHKDKSSRVAVCK